RAASGPRIGNRNSWISRSLAAPDIAPLWLSKANRSPLSRQGEFPEPETEFPQLRVRSVQPVLAIGLDDLLLFRRSHVSFDPRIYLSDRDPVPRAHVVRALGKPRSPGEDFHHVIRMHHVDD